MADSSWLHFSACAKMLGLYKHLICWLCHLHMQCSSKFCSVIYANIELVLHIQLYIDNFYTDLPYACVCTYAYMCACVTRVWSFGQQSPMFVHRVLLFKQQRKLVIKLSLIIYLANLIYTLDKKIRHLVLYSTSMQ